MLAFLPDKLKKKIDIAALLLYFLTAFDINRFFVRLLK